MAHLALSLLGGMHATLNDHPLTGFQSNKARALLAYLAVEADRPHFRDSLAALLWPEVEDKVALTYLRIALVDLRTQLGDRAVEIPILLVEGDSIQLNPRAEVWVDVWEFEEKGAGARGVGDGFNNLQPAIVNQQSSIRNFQSTIALYRGPFLEGFSVQDSAPFEEWCTLKREQLGQQAIRILQRLADFYEACGEYEQALGYARQQVALEPWLEEAHRQIMRSLALNGQVSQALAHYETCKRTLAGDLGVQPSEETVRLHEILLSGRLDAIRPGELLPLPGESPYKGLHFFDEPDAHLFFGREVLTRRLVGHIGDVGASRPAEVGASLQALSMTLNDMGGSPLREPSPHHIITVVGASGSGKSSLVRAGLVPALKRHGGQVAVITPTAHPLENIWDSGRGKKGILVVDQFEELFTLCRSEEERGAFLDRLLTPPRSGSSDGGGGEGVGWEAVVLVLRADFYSHCARYPRLRQALCACQEYIGPMTAAELRQAIEQPALRNGWEFEPGLVDLILRDVGAGEGHPPEPGALPLLEHALLETWQRRSGRRMTLKGYADAGGVHGAIAKTAEDVFSHLTPDQQALARRIFLRLTELGEGTQDTRRRVQLSELVPAEEASSQVQALLQVLADARLVTLEKDTAEVAHEALIREWPLLRQWLSEDREGLRLHRHLTDSAEAWAGMEREAGELYRGARLAQAVEWAESHPKDLNPLEREYLQASQGQAQREVEEREAQRQRELEAAQRMAETERQRAEQEARAAVEHAADARRLRQRAMWLAGALGLALVLVVVTIGLARMANANASQARANAQQANAEADTRATAEALAVDEMEFRSTAEANALASLKKSEAQRLAGVANVMLIEGKQAQLAALLALRSLALGYTPQGDEALSRASRQVYPLRIFSANASAIRGIAFNYDGTQLVTNSADAQVRLWDVASGQLLRTFYGERGNVNNVLFSPDDRYVIANATNIVVWDSSTGEQLLSMDDSLVLTHTQGLSITTAHGITVACGQIDISSDGRYLLVGHTDGSARIWEIATGKEIQRFPGHKGGLVSLVFSPDDQSILTSDYAPDTSGIVHVRLWDVRSGGLLHDLSHHCDSVQGLAFSPDGSTILTASGDQSVCFWNVEGGQLVRCIQPGVGFAFNAAFSPDGRYALAGGMDGVARLWEVASGQEIHQYGQSQIISGVAFSPDGKRVATASFDGTACLWNVEANLVQNEFSVPGAFINYFSFSPDGRTIAAGIGDGSVRVWDVSAGQQIAIFTGLDGQVWAANYTADGQVLFAVDSSTSMVTWDVRTGMTRSLMTIPTSTLMIADISPDGNTAVAVDVLGNAYLFDALRGEYLRRLPGFGYTQSLAFTPDGSRVALGINVDWSGKGQVWVFSYPGLEKLFELDYETDTAFTDLDFSADGRLLLAAGALGNNDLILWDARTGARLQQLTGFKQMQMAVGLSSDRRYAAAGGFDNVTRMWDIATNQEVRRFLGHTRPVISLDFSPDGKWLATGSMDGTLKLWYTDLEELKSAMCAVLPRDLTAEERAFYGIADSTPTCPKFAQP